MPRAKQIVTVVLIGCGVVSLLAALAVGGLIIDSCRSRSDSASPRDILFVLNSGQIPSKQKYQLVHSHRSARSGPGDHWDAYAISIEQFPESLLERDENRSAAWSVSPPTNAIYVEAVRNACSQTDLDRQDWFPSAEDLLTDRYYLRFSRVVVYPHGVGSAEILAYDRNTHTLYYVSFKT